MLKNFLLTTSFTLWILLQWSVKVNCGNPATFIDDKLYIIGDGSFSYLDFSISFNTQNLSWNDLSTLYNSQTGKSSVVTIARGGFNNDTLCLIKYDYSHNDSLLVYTFDQQSNSWSLSLKRLYIGKTFFESVNDYDEKIYMFGGWSEKLGDLNNMLILNTRNFNWDYGKSMYAPIERFYGAVFLPNQHIIYIGKLIDFKSSLFVFSLKKFTSFISFQGALMMIQLKTQDPLNMMRCTDH